MGPIGSSLDWPISTRLNSVTSDCLNCNSSEGVSASALNVICTSQISFLILRHSHRRWCHENQKQNIFSPDPKGWRHHAIILQWKLRYSRAISWTKLGTINLNRPLTGTYLTGMEISGAKLIDGSSCLIFCRLRGPGKQDQVCIQFGGGLLRIARLHC